MRSMETEASTVALPGRAFDRPQALFEADRLDAATGWNGEAAHVLVVDDDEAVRALIAGVLTEAGYAVTTAASATAALALLGASDVDLIVSDLDMPGTSGLGLL